jgi:hypothetical protein
VVYIHYLLRAWTTAEGKSNVEDNIFVVLHATFLILIKHAFEVCAHLKFIRRPSLRISVDRWVVELIKLFGLAEIGGLADTYFYEARRRCITMRGRRRRRGRSEL